MRQSMLLGGIEQRIWNDMTYGTLSSDGHCVFAVEEDQDEAMGVGMPRKRRHSLGAGLDRRTGASHGRGTARRTDFGFQPAGGLRHSDGETPLAHRWPGRPARPAPSRDVFPWSAAAAVGPALRAGRNQRRNPPLGPRRRHGKPALVAAIGGGRARRASGCSCAVGPAHRPPMPTASWFAPPRPGRSWASSWPRDRSCGDTATANSRAAMAA